VTTTADFPRRAFARRILGGTGPLITVSRS
jgi:hypothetical protein